MKSRVNGKTPRYGRRRVNGKTPRYGRRRERRWTPTRAKAQVTTASPNRLETHLVRKSEDNGHQRALSPWIDGWMDGWMDIHIIHSFIHCRHLYSASSSGATQKRSQPQHGRIMLF